VRHWKQGLDPRGERNDDLKAKTLLGKKGNMMEHDRMGFHHGKW
jgi:hypothetical protein